MREIASAVLMVEPNTFGYNAATAASNTFSSEPEASPGDVRASAAAEFDAVVTTLGRFGVEVVTYAHHDGVPRPDAVFPNNWLTTWPDGRVYQYPMAAPSRRLERHEAVLAELSWGYEVKEVIEVVAPEYEEAYLEGTGVIVFDHEARSAYACESVRCDSSLFEQHMRELEYEPVLFRAADRDGVAIYHTNVMMGIQSTTAVLCSEAIRDVAARRRVVGSLEQSGHEIVHITEEQMRSYCGNLIELANQAGERCLLMSQSAYGALSERQRAVLGRDRELLPVDVATIQSIGGGSVRCMVAEIFLPPA